jgi:tartrate dehydrogenase/decarboxylase / D-malate dehydrogenase
MSGERKIYRVGVIAGDGIGPEVVQATIPCADAVAERFGFELRWTHYDWGSQRHRRDGAMMPADGLDQLASEDALLLGAIGAPDIPDHVTLWGC